MKAADVVMQLTDVIPTLTNMFNDTLKIVSLTYDAGIVTAVSDTPLSANPFPYTLTTGAGVIISGALVPNPITSLTSVGLVASATTENNHDLTANQMDISQGYQPLVDIQGAAFSEYDGIFNLLTAINRRNFTYQLNATTTSPDTGAPILLEDLAFGYNGFFIVTVIDDFTFTYPLPYALSGPAQGTITASYNTRITSAVNSERAIQMYSQFNTDQYYMFVVLSDTSVSKDREITTDLPQTDNSGTDFRQCEILGFSVYIFAPSTFDLSDAVVRDTMEEVRTYLYKALLRVKFPTYLVLDGEHSSLFMTFTTGHSQFLYNGSYYIHKFDFENRADITYPDTVLPDKNVAFRDIDFNILNMNPSPQIIASINVIDLDDVPLS
jgi:hypothetical protein